MRKWTREMLRRDRPESCLASVEKAKLWGWHFWYDIIIFYHTVPKNRGWTSNKIGKGTSLFTRGGSCWLLRMGGCRFVAIWGQVTVGGLYAPLFFGDGNNQSIFTRIWLIHIYPWSLSSQWYGMTRPNKIHFDPFLLPSGKRLHSYWKWP